MPVPDFASTLVAGSHGGGTLPRVPAAMAHPTGRAFRSEHRPAESSPALLQPLHVVGRSETRNQLVAELPAAIGQVLAGGGGGEERESGLHGQGSIPVYEDVRPLPSVGCSRQPSGGYSRGSGPFLGAVAHPSVEHDIVPHLSVTECRDGVRDRDLKNRVRPVVRPHYS